jgi:hypothetical protein
MRKLLPTRVFHTYRPTVVNLVLLSPHKILLSNYEFRENLCSKSHGFLNSVNEICSTFYVYLDKFGTWQV